MDRIRAAHPYVPNHRSCELCTRCKRLDRTLLSTLVLRVRSPSLDSTLSPFARHVSWVVLPPSSAASAPSAASHQRVPSAHRQGAETRGERLRIVPLPLRRHYSSGVRRGRVPNVGARMHRPRQANPRIAGRPAGNTTDWSGELAASERGQSSRRPSTAHWNGNPVAGEAGTMAPEDTVWVSGPTAIRGWRCSSDAPGEE